MNARLAFRLPMDVAESWRTAARAAGLSLSDWVRAQVRVDGQDTVITHKPSPQKVPKRREHVPVDPALVRAIATAGNNLNQIARRLNGGEAVPRGEMLMMLVETEKRLQEILDQCTSSS
jgi:Bacterial mobilisation protein (MobC).